MSSLLILSFHYCLHYFLLCPLPTSCIYFCHSFYIFFYLSFFFLLTVSLTLVILSFFHFTLFPSHSNSYHSYFLSFFLYHFLSFFSFDSYPYLLYSVFLFTLHYFLLSPLPTIRIYFCRPFYVTLYLSFFSFDSYPYLFCLSLHVTLFPSFSSSLLWYLFSLFFLLYMSSTFSCLS